MIRMHYERSIKFLEELFQEHIQKSGENAEAKKKNVKMIGKIAQNTIRNVNNAAATQQSIGYGALIVPADECNNTRVVIEGELVTCYKKMKEVLEMVSLHSIYCIHL